MDFKALMTKLETIDKKQVLTEGEDRPAAKKKETTWTDKSGKKHPATQVQGSKSVAADKEADKDRKKHDKDLDEMSINSAIARELLKEFNIVAEEEDEELDEAGNPWEGKNPEWAAAWSKLTPQDQQWLGGSDPTDEFILARAPNKGKPATARSIGAGTKPAASDAGAANPATGVNAQGQNVTMPDGTNPETGEKAQAATTPSASDTGEVPGVTTQASPLAEPPADTGAATKPAEAPEIDPAKLKRFQELLAKVQGGGATPAKEQVTYEDDRILALIRGL